MALSFREWRRLTGGTDRSAYEDYLYELAKNARRANSGTPIGRVLAPRKIEIPENTLAILFEYATMTDAEVSDRGIKDLTEILPEVRRLLNIPENCWPDPLTKGGRSS